MKGVLDGIAHRYGSGFITPSRATLVLNALRHQWLGSLLTSSNIAESPRCSTPCGISGWAALISCNSADNALGAQRLAASVVGQQRPPESRHNQGLKVLNALRHQWLGSLSGLVSSAFFIRAQRLAASVVGQSRSLTWCGGDTMCSTPCGISGWADTIYKSEKFISSVLNALRHQWLGRMVYRLKWLRDPVLNALRHQWLGSISPVQRRWKYFVVLNALRHQWLGRTSAN